MDISYNIQTIYTHKNPYSESSSGAWWKTKCPGCSASTMLALAIFELGTRSETLPTGGKTLSPLPKNFTHSVKQKRAWLMCPSCHAGAVATGSYFDVVECLPAALPYRVPENLPEDVAHTWGEALSCFSGGSYTACALMCRKLLLHMAVDKGLEPGDGNGPNFADCLKHLVREGYVTQRQADGWADLVRQWGNMATHEVAPIDRATADRSLQFTLQLLEMVYSFQTE